MIKKYYYQSNLGTIIIENDDDYLISLDFSDEDIKNSNDVDITPFKETIDWLDTYFQGKIPSFTPKYKFNNLSQFRSNVYNVLKTIPYGKVITYKEFSKILEEKTNKKVSCQALGQALKHNPIPLIFPCHRVIGTNNLGGFNKGIERKIKLLELEGININNYK